MATAAAWLEMATPRGCSMRPSLSTCLQSRCEKPFAADCAALLATERCGHIRPYQAHERNHCKSDSIRSAAASACLKGLLTLAQVQALSPSDAIEPPPPAAKLPPKCVPCSFGTAQAQGMRCGADGKLGRVCGRIGRTCMSQGAMLLTMSAEPHVLMLQRRERSM